MSTRITMAGMLKLELPAATVRLVDGGTLPVDGETYLSRDPFIGVLSGFEALNEGVGDEAPAGSLTFLPPDATPAAALNTGDNQGARLRLWTVDVDQATGLPIGAPTQEADWIVDYPAMSIGEGERELELAFVSSGDRFFQVDRGNALAPNFHRSIHPGEAGLDAASGAETSVPWGAPSQPRGTSMSSGGGSSYGGGNTAYV
jgi:hypothetical protein